MMLTMPDLKWTVRIYQGSELQWTWIYSFSRQGSVSWLDPYNGKNGKGTWRIEKDKMTTRWVKSATYEEWDVPINPLNATGQCYMSGGTYDLYAVAQNYYLKPGDVVYFGEKIIKGNGTVATVIFADEVRTGGTVAWICRNPGAIRDGDKFGAIRGKRLNVIKAGQYAIFPDDITGLMAVVKVLRGYGGVTINGAMQKYAGKGDGGNNPDQYAKILARGMRLSENTSLTSMSDEQLLRMATLITGVETTEKGTSWPRDSSDMPEEIKGRLTRAE